MVVTGKRKRVIECDCVECFYCDAKLSSRHEHDHFPLPFRHGGEQIVPCCLNCHDLKDRIPFSEWNPDAIVEGIQALPPLGRIMLVKLLVARLDLLARRDAA